VKKIVNIKEMKGGALVWDDDVDKAAAIRRILASCTLYPLAKGTYGVTWKAKLRGAVRWPVRDRNGAHYAEVTSLIIKISSINGKMFFNDALQVNGSKQISSVGEAQFLREIEAQNDAHEKSLAWGAAICPTILYHECLKYDMFFEEFPFLRRFVDAAGLHGQKIGIIVMQSVQNPDGTCQTLHSNQDDRLVAMGRGMFYWLAKTGWKHLDHHQGNVFLSGDGVVIGDFGEAQRLTPAELEFVEANDYETATDDVKEELMKIVYGVNSVGSEKFTARYFYPFDSDEMRETRKVAESEFRADLDTVPANELEYRLEREMYYFKLQHDGFVKMYQWIRNTSRVPNAEFDPEVDVLPLREIIRTLQRMDATDASPKRETIVSHVLSPPPRREIMREIANAVSRFAGTIFDGVRDAAGYAARMIGRTDPDMSPDKKRSRRGGKRSRKRRSRRPTRF
jgi:hypothetical protein